MLALVKRSIVLVAISDRKKLQDGAVCLAHKWFILLGLCMN